MKTFILDNSLFILLMIGTLFSFIWLSKQGKSLKIGILFSAVLAICHTLTGVVCVKVFAVMETLDLNSFSGMSLFGGIFFMPFLYWIFAKLTKRNFGDICDLFTPCMIVTLMCARVNCIHSGCCIGKFIGAEIYRWPTREAELIFYALLLLFLLTKRKRIPHGMLYPAYMMSYGVFRFIVEWFRDSSTTAMLHIGHLWALVACIAGYIILRNNKKRTSKNIPNRTKKGSRKNNP